MVSRAGDNASPELMQEVFTANIDSRTFTYDVVRPTSVVTLPRNNGIYGGAGNELSVISATTYDKDNVAQKRVEVVSFAMKESASGMWWNGVSTFSALSAVWSSGTYVSDDLWTWARPPLPELVYKLYSKATDYAGNVEGANQIEEITFTYDLTGPASQLTSPADWSYQGGVPTISGTSYDVIGVSATYVAIGEQDTGMWWNGSTFSATSESWQQYTSGSATDWQYSVAICRATTGI